MTKIISSDSSLSQVGSNTVLRDPETGAKYRGREYPWGTVNIEDQVRTQNGPFFYLQDDSDFMRISVSRITVTSWP